MSVSLRAPSHDRARELEHPTNILLDNLKGTEECRFFSAIRGVVPLFCFLVRSLVATFSPRLIYFDKK